MGVGCGELGPDAPLERDRPHSTASSSNYRPIGETHGTKFGATASLDSFQRGIITVTFLGTSSLYITDGQTHLLVDGFFSRPGLLTTFYLDPDFSLIDAGLERLGRPPLNAVFVVHSHHDHVMDAPYIAYRTGAYLFGSPSTYNVVKGYGLERSIRFVEAEYNTTAAFGGFNVTFRQSLHAQTFLTNAEQPGFITQPLRRRPLGYSVLDFKEGRVYSLHFAHQSGYQFIVHASDNIGDATLAGLRADVVFLGAGTSYRQTDRDWERYLTLAVDRTYARMVIPIHWDNFFRPLAPPLSESLFADLYRVQNSIAARNLAYLKLDAWESFSMGAAP